VAEGNIMSKITDASVGSWGTIESTSPVTLPWAEVWRTEKLLARQACYKQVSPKIPLPVPAEMMEFDWWNAIGTNVLPVIFTPKGLVMEQHDWDKMGIFPKQLVLDIVIKYDIEARTQAGDKIVA
jgi:hypothetical protein